jgi:hypothetical protein
MRFVAAIYTAFGGNRQRVSGVPEKRIMSSKRKTP